MPLKSGMAEKIPLVLVPGTLCNEVAWAPQARALSDIADPEIADLRGQASLSEMAATILQKAPPVFALAGHSMGGRIALEIVDQAPERVSRLALLDTGTHPVAEGEPARRAKNVDVVATDGLAAFAEPWVRAILPPYRLEGIELVAAVRGMILSFDTSDFQAQSTAMLGRRDLAPILKSIECPTLVLCGEDDTYSPPNQHRSIAAEIADARLVIVPRCGHMAPMERSDAVSAALRDWLLSQ